MPLCVLIPDRFVANPDVERSVLGADVEIMLGNARSVEEIAPEVWGRCDAVLAWHELQYTSETIAQLKNCKAIVRVGAGYDNIDLEAARRRGIAVSNVPDYGTNDVADHTMALLLALTRGLQLYNSAVADGQWEWTAAGSLHRLTGSILGIIGLGRIGTAVAVRAQAFGLKVRFYDPYLPRGIEKSLKLEREESLVELARRSDIVSIHTPLTAETRRMINGAFFSQCRRGVILLNTARGAIIDLDALDEALRLGHVRAAGLDVLPLEPPDPHHPLIAAWRRQEGWIRGRMLLTPHAAFYNEESYAEMRRKAAEEARRLLCGEEPWYAVDPNGRTQHHSSTGSA